MYSPVFDAGFNYLGSEGGLPAPAEDLLAFDTLPGMSGSNAGFDDLVNCSWFDVQQSTCHGDGNPELNGDDQSRPGLNRNTQGVFSLL